MTTLHDRGGVSKQPLHTFFWALTISWSQLLAPVCVKWPIHLTHLVVIEFMTYQQHLQQHADSQSLFIITYSYQQLLQLFECPGQKRSHFKEQYVKSRPLCTYPKSTSVEHLPCRVRICTGHKAQKKEINKSAKFEIFKPGMSCNSQESPVPRKK